MAEQPGAASTVIEQHRIRGAHRCSCGWEGDLPTVHIIDVLNGLDVAERMEAMGMEPVAFDNPEHYPAQHVRLMQAPMPRRERLLYGEIERA